MDLPDPLGRQIQVLLIAFPFLVGATSDSSVFARPVCVSTEAALWILLSSVLSVSLLCFVAFSRTSSHCIAAWQYARGKQFLFCYSRFGFPLCSIKRKQIRRSKWTPMGRERVYQAVVDGEWKMEV